MPLTGTETRLDASRKQSVVWAIPDKHAAFNRVFLLYSFLCAKVDNEGVSLSRQ